MNPYYQDDWTTIYHGDSREVLPSLPKASAIVTDPPYGLGFMGKEWDTFDKSQFGRKGCEGENDLKVKKNFNILPRYQTGGLYEFMLEWAEIAKKSCLPGSPLLSFGGTRTFHRIACAIEDAGWEIRDTLMYVYGSGFPKSLNIHKQLQNKAKSGNMEVYGLPRTEPQTQYHLRLVSEADLQAGIYAKAEQGKVLQPSLSEQSISESRQATPYVGRDKPSMEGGCDIEASERELQRCQICAMSQRLSGNGPARWLCYGTPFGYGTAYWSPTPQDRSCPSYRPQSSEQQNRQSHAISNEQGSQNLRGLIGQWEGYGTALKPAYEPIILAMNPLDGTFANNALKHGVAGLNIDECRIGTEGGETHKGGFGSGIYGDSRGVKTNRSELKGRFPANFIHDGSQMVLELFPESKPTKPHKVYSKIDKYEGYGTITQKHGEVINYDESNGSAARFFYTAKSSKRERGEGNNHPTVKPLALMEYLINLVKMPEHNLIIDPFMGSGTTLLACIRLGIPCIGIDNDEHTCEIAARRCIQAAMELA